MDRLILSKHTSSGRVLRCSSDQMRAGSASPKSSLTATKRSPWSSTTTARPRRVASASTSV
ncbi:hypothetical protein OG742_02675 [Streptomyces sp. NBC_00828]|uniref:hypothetical protein n=1 Tax=Streptomyces sp. NBC_00828 TaxID=2903678 RepID=UPI00386E395F